MWQKRKFKSESNGYETSRTEESKVQNMDDVVLAVYKHTFSNIPGKEKINNNHNLSLYIKVSAVFSSS